MGSGPVGATEVEGRRLAWRTDEVLVLVAHGSLDMVIPPANAALLAARFPGAAVEIFDGCGHALMAQQSQRLIELIVAGA